MMIAEMMELVSGRGLLDRGLELLWRHVERAQRPFEACCKSWIESQNTAMHDDTDGLR